MKKLQFFLITLLISLLPYEKVQAQKIGLSPFAGYETGSSVYTSLGYLLIGDGMDYGVNADFNLGGNRFAELSFSHMMTRLNVDEGSNERYICDLGVNYYSIGILQDIRPSSVVVPYGLLALGLVNFRPQTDGISGENKMHFSFAGGIKIKASDRIGFRLQARLLMPVFFSGAYFSGGAGGAGASISATSVAFQGDFTAAIVFVLK